ncbi:MAG: biotin transporter BioY [candidate division Zixibacteria bacterium]|nr:biotin transporter BioY [candidate division Zixibacteria bacterium]
MFNTNEAAVSRFYIGELAWGRQLSYMLAFNIVLIASSYIQIPLPFSPVPVTAQAMAVLACGLFLGPGRAALTVLAYLTEGAMGLPVFAGGTAGLVKFFGPTGGYLIGFVGAAFVVGMLSEKIQSMTFGKLLGVLSLGMVCIYIPGLTVISLFVPEGAVLKMGLYPFLPGMAVKLMITASALSAYKKIRRSI